MGDVRDGLKNVLEVKIFKSLSFKQHGTVEACNDADG